MRRVIHKIVLVGDVDVHRGSYLFYKLPCFSANGFFSEFIGCCATYGVTLSFGGRSNLRSTIASSERMRKAFGNAVAHITSPPQAKLAHIIHSVVHDADNMS